MSERRKDSIHICIRDIIHYGAPMTSGQDIPINHVDRIMRSIMQAAVNTPSTRWPPKSALSFAGVQPTNAQSIQTPWGKHPPQSSPSCQTRWREQSI